MRRFVWVAVLSALLPLGCGAGGGPDALPSQAAPESPVSLTTVAIRVHRTEAMKAFYSEAFGATFRPVDTFGIQSWFGEVGGVTLKLVPIREETDFVGFGSHQPGFRVRDVAEVIRIAEKHGGRPEGETVRRDGAAHASVRDPDGNTIELYGPP